MQPGDFGICSGCGDPCVAILVDRGIGPYEFAGARGYDSRPAVVSKCCEWPVIPEETWLLWLDADDGEQLGVRIAG